MSETDVNSPKPATESVPTVPAEDLIEIKDFAKIKLRVAQVVSAEPVPNSQKLLRLMVDLGEAGGRRQILAGIAKLTTPESLVGRKIVVIANLKPAKLMGVESQGMLLAAGDKDPLGLLQVDTDVPIGSTVR